MKSVGNYFKKGGVIKTISAKGLMKRIINERRSK